MFKSFSILFFLVFLWGCAPSLPQQSAALANVDLGIAFLQQGDVVTAKEKILLAQQQNPKDPQVLDGLAFFYERTGEPVLADHYYQLALKQAPLTGASENNYGAFLCRQGHYVEAITHFNAALMDASYLYPAEAYENAGLCALKIPNLVLAEQNFKQAILHDPTRSVALFELAKLSYNQRRYQEARVYFSHYQTITPQLSHEAQRFAAQLATKPEQGTL